ncbi:similar to MFS transporter [Plenodomus lingam JN3]|uniref:Similar to MFS transporter n=1 Tax=Leptosphaeria maculans (strain JN3 / isolate v23.1.3 / race Av1-4-5-6-7-8) TaxID=985895 RepID=E4ZYM7_LEPMJ|nr:similar to MFS transporter [Plenodomus lingam JN3]CBX96553.1 similar to MFS transporter [Plenodomus lingam JN3]
MGFGVLEDKHMAMPPGTATINSTETEGTKWARKEPTASTDMSPVWKETIMVILAFSSGVTTSLGPMITPGLQIVAMKYNVSIGMVTSLLIGFLAFWIGFTTFFTAAGANIWGKRPFFVISIVILLGTNVWGYFGTSFASLAVMRAIQGMASAPLETLVTSTVSDLFYVHQRGTRISLWGCMLASGVLLGQIISGTIIQNLSFEATFGISALIYIPLFFGIYFFVIETTYNGPRPTATKVIPDEKDLSFLDEDEPKRSYSQSLSIFNGRLSQESFWKNVWKPLPLIAYPAVLFSTVVFASYFAWLLTISVLSVSIFSAPPYSLGPADIGLTNIPLLGVSLIGSPLSGWLADAVAKVMARRNNGIFEPEFRLVLMIPATVFATLGFIGFGISVQQQLPLIWPLTFMSIHALSVPFASTASLAYVIDCHPRDANQAFVTINFAKAIFTFVATTYANGWLAQAGPRGVFDTISIINTGICAMTIPAYIFGKRFRSLVARSNFGQKLSA